MDFYGCVTTKKRPASCTCVSGYCGIGDFKALQMSQQLFPDLVEALYRKRPDQNDIPPIAMLWHSNTELKLRTTKTRDANFCRPDKD
jgi:hypothetical protein